MLWKKGFDWANVNFGRLLFFFFIFREVATRVLIFSGWHDLPSDSSD